MRFAGSGPLSHGLGSSARERPRNRIGDRTDHGKLYAAAPPEDQPPAVRLRPLDPGLGEDHYYQRMIRDFLKTHRPRTRGRPLARGVLAALLVLAGLPLGGRAAEPDDRTEPSLEGVYYDWSLYGMQEGGQPVCYLASGLERSSDVIPRRRPPVILITNRPGEGKKNVVSVNPGYTYEQGSAVLMTIGRRQFPMFTAGAAAWAEDGDDSRIVAAIRGGSTLVVTGRMKDGPTTTDTFSLKGFGPALAALDRACPMPGPAITPKPAHRKRKNKT